MTSLAHLPCGTQAVVAALPRSHGLAKRLIALGLIPGAEVSVLQNRGRGAIIIEVHGARLALGRGQAERVVVESITEPVRGAADSSGTDPVTAATCSPEE